MVLRHCCVVLGLTAGSGFVAIAFTVGQLGEATNGVSLSADWRPVVVSVSA